MANKWGSLIFEKCLDVRSLGNNMHLTRFPQQYWWIKSCLAVKQCSDPLPVSPSVHIWAAECFWSIVWDTYISLYFSNDRQMRYTFKPDDCMVISIPLGSIRNMREGQLMPEKFTCVFKDSYKVFLRGRPKELGVRSEI